MADLPSGFQHFRLISGKKSTQTLTLTLYKVDEFPINRVQDNLFIWVGTSKLDRVKTVFCFNSGSSWFIWTITSWILFSFYLFEIGLNVKFVPHWSSIDYEFKSYANENYLPGRMHPNKYSTFYSLYIAKGTFWPYLPTNRNSPYKTGGLKYKRYISWGTSRAVLTSL